MTSLAEHAGRPEVGPWLRGWDDEKPQATLVWRTWLPVRGAPPASDQEIAEFFDAAPLHLTERLETEGFRIRDWLIARARKLMETADARATALVPDDVPPPLAGRTVVAFVLGAPGAARPLTLAQLAMFGETSGRKDALLREISGQTLVLDARLGGVNSGGLFQKDSTEPARTPDNDEQWEKQIGHRIRSVAPDAPEAEADWRKPYVFDIRRDGEGNPLRQLRVEKYRDSGRYGR